MRGRFSDRFEREAQHCSPEAAQASTGSKATARRARTTARRGCAGSPLAESLQFSSSLIGLFGGLGPPNCAIHKCHATRGAECWVFLDLRGCQSQSVLGGSPRPLPHVRVGARALLVRHWPGHTFRRYQLRDETPTPQPQSRRQAGSIFPGQTRPRPKKNLSVSTISSSTSSDSRHLWACTSKSARSRT